MTRRSVYLVPLLIIPAVVVALFAYRHAPVTTPPLSSAALDTKVTLQSVSESQIEIVESINPTADVTGQTDFTGSVVVRPGAVRGAPHVMKVSENSVLQTYSIAIPQSARRIDVSKQVISHEGVKFRLPPFSAKDLPETQRIGKHHVTVRKMWVGNLMRGARGIVVLFDITPGYMPYNLRFEGERGRRLTDGTWGEAGRGYRWFSFLGDKPAPRELSLEVTVAREKTAWVTFKNVRIPR